MGRDFYKTLGVDRSASADQIKRAYRRLTKKYHPDRNPDDPSAEQKFKEVQEAYSVLGDAQKRSDYDRFGDAAVGHWDTDPGGQRVYTWGSGAQVPFDDLEDLFSAFGGGASVFRDFPGRGRRAPGRRKAPPARGQDVERAVNLSFDQAVKGTTVEMDVARIGPGGRETLDVRIPPGVRDGQRIRLKGKGRPGANGGPAGDLYLACSVRPHAYFRREGQDIYLDVAVSITEAALGTKIEVPTLSGPVEMTIPPGTPGGSKLRLRGRGIAGGDGSPGDQYVVVRIVPPKSLTDEQKELLKRLGESLAENPRRDVPW